MFKRAISGLLVLVMTLSLFAGVSLTAGAEDGGRTATNYEYPCEPVVLNEGYDNNYAEFFSLARNTGIVVPGLSKESGRTPQGISYWEAGETGYLILSSEAGTDTAGNKAAPLLSVLTLDGELVGEFGLYNRFYTDSGEYEDTPREDHLGGLGVSKYNLYISMSGGAIGYIPLDTLFTKLQNGERKLVYSVYPADYVGEKEPGDIRAFAKIDALGGANSSYTSFDPYSNTLITGNFYYPSATGYTESANSASNSLTLGYTLSGSNSAEEWNSLYQGITGNGPSFAVTYDNMTMDRIQYVYYDSARAKLYVSRSYARRVTKNYISELDVFDLDVSKTEDATIQIPVGDNTKTVSAYSLTESKLLRSLNNLPMGEGMVVVEDELYCLYESGAYKYRAQSLQEAQKSASDYYNVCIYPTDNLWAIDLPALLGETETQTESVDYYYKRITDINNINSTDEYLIVFESYIQNDDGQRKLYALSTDRQPTAANSSATAIHGVELNYSGDISKQIEVYNDFGESVAGTETKISEDQLLWKVSTDNSLRKLQSKISGSYLYLTSENVYMSSKSHDKNDLRVAKNRAGEEISGFFQIYCDTLNGSCLWCSDGTSSPEVTKFTTATVDLLSAYSMAYRDLGKTESALVNPTDSDLYEIERPGTFHSGCSTTADYNYDYDAATGARIRNLAGTYVSDAATGAIKRAAKDVDIAYTYLMIFERVRKEAPEVIGESGTHLSKSAKLTSDGTYTIDLSTFTTAQVETLIEKKPLDIILLLDQSGSMDSKYRAVTATRYVNRVHSAT